MFLLFFVHFAAFLPYVVVIIGLNLSKYVDNCCVLRDQIELTAVSYKVCCHLIHCLCFVDSGKGLEISRPKL